MSTYSNFSKGPIGLLSKLGKLAAWSLSNTCLLCGEGVGATAICYSCSDALPRANPSACECCALPLPHGATARRCGACLRRRFAYDTVRAPLAYTDEVAWLIRRYKFHCNLAAGRVLGDVMASALAVDHRGGSELPDVLVPVPLHVGRLRERGFDQALELTRDLSALLDIGYSEALSRTRATKPQSQTDDAVVRRRNLRGAFAARAAPVVGRRVCIVDDVMTTGATVHEAAKVIRAAGAVTVNVWCCARTPRLR